MHRYIGYWPTIFANIVKPVFIEQPWDPELVNVYKCSMYRGLIPVLINVTVHEKCPMYECSEEDCTVYLNLSIDRNYLHVHALGSFVQCRHLIPALKLRAAQA